MKAMQDRVVSLTWNMVHGSMRENLDNPDFTNEVQSLADMIYEDPTKLALFPLDSLFMLLAIKTFYVDKKHDNPHTISYIGRMLDRFARTDSAPLEVREFRKYTKTLEDRADSSVHPLYLMDVLLVGESNPRALRSISQYIADHTLFWEGLYPDADPSTSGFGASCYRGLSRSRIVSSYDQEVFSELSRIFPFYLDGMNTLARNFLHAPNKKILLDLMLQAITRSEVDDPLVAAKAERDAIAYGALLHLPDSLNSN